MYTALFTEATEKQDAKTLVNTLLDERDAAPVCLTCSFQAEDIIVLHLLRERLPDLPVLFLETGYHFPETYRFRDRITAEWRLNLVNALPKQTVQQQESKLGILYREDPARCCQLRKVDPLMASLEPFEIWFTGLRREQSPTDVYKRQESRNSDLGFALAFPFTSTSSSISGLETFGDNQFITAITAFPVLRNQEKYQIRYDVSHTSGRHAPRVGVNFIHEPVLSGCLLYTSVLAQSASAIGRAPIELLPANANCRS